MPRGRSAVTTNTNRSLTAGERHSSLIGLARSVTVHCTFGHVAEVEVTTLWRRLPMWTSVTDLARHLRCANCDEKGRCEVDARKALGYDRLDEVVI